jgi:hypothetical protein
MKRGNLHSRHSSESWNSCDLTNLDAVSGTVWIPAFAGMTGKNCIDGDLRLAGGSQ